MTPSDPPVRRFLVEPLETTQRSHRRTPSDQSDVSQSPSFDSDSTSSSMAAIARSPLRADHLQLSGLKSEIEHIENTPNHDVQMADADHTPKTEKTIPETHAGVVSSSEPEQPVQPKPRRKFAPEPVETSSRSSKKEQDTENGASPTIKRKFAPEPIETTSKSSKTKATQQEEEKQPRPRRKFAVEPIETTSTTSKDREKKTDGLENGARPKRRFAVEPVETSTRSSKEKEQEPKTTKPKKKFAVEPIETSTSSSKKKKDDSTDKLQETPSRSSSGGRRFTPELVGTAKGSYRKKPGIESAIPKWLRKEVAEEEGSWSAPEVPESKFSAANLAKKARADPRRHSYNVPDLPMIQSDSSEEEDSVPQTPGTLSQIDSHEQQNLKPRRHHHEHVHVHDQNLQDLKTLREQAVAAYGSQEDRVQFGHYGGDSDDEDYSFSVGELSIQDGADPQLFRRMSHHDLHLVMEDMRQHHDQLERAKRGLEEDTAGISRFSAAALAARHHLHISHPAGAHYKSRHETEKQHNDEDEEYARMRKAASPPMQGDEIKFPFSVSPKMTRCDPDQMPRPRRANSEDDEEHEIGVEGMWSAVVSPIKTVSPSGLWGGLCQKDENQPTKPSTPLRSGIQTPAFESIDPLGTRTPRGAKTPRRGGGGALWGGAAFMPLTPPRSKHEKSNDGFAAALDKKLNLERQIDDEFQPHVITQIYNYLSLGYPPIARPFDEELSKISRISITELRKGDRSATGTMKGHVGVPEGEGDAEEDQDGRVKGCRRWDALRLYVREWAKQSPLFQCEQTMPNIGTAMWGNNAPVRKGSWGF